MHTKKPKLNQSETLFQNICMSAFLMMISMYEDKRHMKCLFWEKDNKDGSLAWTDNFKDDHALCVQSRIQVRTFFCFFVLPSIIQ